MLRFASGKFGPKVAVAIFNRVFKLKDTKHNYHTRCRTFATKERFGKQEYSLLLCSALPYAIVLCSTLQYSVVLCSAL